MKKASLFFIVAALLIFFVNSDFKHESAVPESADIPLPENPRPDFERANWKNLNGTWQFEFDSLNAGLDQKWFAGKQFHDKILVPYPWGSKLSGLEDKADIGWYKRTISVPSSWKGKRIFLVVGASDWLSKAWLDGQYLGEFQGGYFPFEFEITKYVNFDSPQQLVVRVDDTPHPFKLEGKQGYGKARGIWQTPYLEARGQEFFKVIHFNPDIDHNKVTVEGILSDPSPVKTSLRFTIDKGGKNEKSISKDLSKGITEFTWEIPINNPHLWTLDDPYLYWVDARLLTGAETTDEVSTYFGMRKISTMNLPGTDYKYVALNNQPIYLKMTLDQAYDPDGFYSWPSDEFMRDEILRSKKIGLNCNRIHVKIDFPRKLYWADKLGLLIMADVPNSWGEPDDAMKKESETAMVNMIRRDYNHPAIFQWVLFNETWGLFTNTDSGRLYLPQTQKWVSEMYDEAKGLDPTRLVEDNSACNYDHVKTDINSWHAYLPGYGWKKMLDEFSEKTYPGSGYNFAKGYLQGDQPMVNSECGNVWGYDGSTGDVDWSWDYHMMMNEFRLHPKVAGWLYTEHHDVINEWNGYYRFDRSSKYTGFGELVNGMELNDLHKDIYLVPDMDLCTDQKPGSEINIPLSLSVMTGDTPSDKVRIKASIKWWDITGTEHQSGLGMKEFPLVKWSTNKIGEWPVKLPSRNGLALIAFKVEDISGNILQHNFLTFNLTDGTYNSNADLNTDSQHFRILSVNPTSISDSQWSIKSWPAMENLKMDGAGTGYFEYKIPIPDDMNVSDIKEVTFRAEISAKQLFGKDRDNESKMSGDYMRGQGTFDPSRNPNSYPMTDDKKFPSVVTVSVNGTVIGAQYLPDDPADSRGILSWHSQLRDKKLREAGSYGYMVNIPVPGSLLRDAIAKKAFTIRLQADEIAGGLAVYGRNSGRYPLDPSIIFLMKE